MVDTPVITLFSDPTVKVTLTGFTAKTLSAGINGAFVQFEGDARARLLRGGGGTGAWAITGVFHRSEGALAAQLKNLLALGEIADDPRLILTPGGSMAAVIPKPVVVACLTYGFQITPPGSGIYQFDMQLTEVVA